MPDSSASGISPCSHHVPGYHSPEYLRADTPGGGYPDKHESRLEPLRAPATATCDNSSTARTATPATIPKDSVLHRSFTPRPVPRIAAETTFRLGLATSPPGHRALCATPLQYEQGANDSP
jgi:hypothetical protein